MPDADEKFLTPLPEDEAVPALIRETVFGGGFDLDRMIERFFADEAQP